MQTQSVTVHLSEPLYKQIRKQAEDAHRSVEEQLVHIAADAVSSQPRLAPDVEAELAALAKLPDDELWRAARVTLPARTAARIAAINRKRQRGEITPADEAAQARLLAQADRVMLIRAEAAVLLKERGHDVSVLLRPE